MSSKRVSISSRGRHVSIRGEVFERYNGDAFEDLSASAKICQVATIQLHLQNVDDDRKFF